MFEELIAVASPSMTTFIFVMVVFWKQMGMSGQKPLSETR
jgi:hypothetical protein